MIGETGGQKLDSQVGIPMRLSRMLGALADKELRGHGALNTYSEAFSAI